MIGSLRYRSISNRERLQNEIQLAFNSVAQYDAGITVDIGRASQTDSAAMKTIEGVGAQSEVNRSIGERREDGGGRIKVLPRGALASVAERRGVERSEGVERRAK